MLLSTAVASILGDGGISVASQHGVVDPVRVSVPHGFYEAPFALELSTPTAGAEIRYTLDGTEPTADHGLVYSGPLTVDRTTTLRAGAFKAGDLAPPTIAQTYLFLDDVIRQSPDGQAPAGWPASWGKNVVDYGMDPEIVNHRRYGGNRLKDALRAIPSISVTTDLANLFDPVIGIYANSAQEGREWERPVSVELLNPDGSAGFQIGAGLRIRGSASSAGSNPKHSFRLFFRDEYGAETLDYPLFGEEGAGSFAKVDLRTAQNQSWSGEGSRNNNFVAEVFSRDAMRDMGQPYTRSRFYHLYLNGQYWGLYQTEERPDADFGATYLGGDPDNFDVIRPETPFEIGATDGDLDAWRRLWQGATVPGGLASDAAYYRLQGKNPDGSDNPDYEVLLDVDNLIDYMSTIIYAGNIDGPIVLVPDGYRINNFYAMRDRTGREGFQFLMRDAELSLLNLGEDRNGPFPLGSDFETFNPQFLHQQLMENAEYRRRFLDHIRTHFYNNGVFTPPAAIGRFRARANEIDRAILGESARWGDAQRPNSPLTHRDWKAAVDRVTGRYHARPHEGRPQSVPGPRPAPEPPAVALPGSGHAVLAPDRFPGVRAD